MRLTEYIRNILLATDFLLRGTIGYIVTILIQNLFIPLAITIMVFLATTSGEGVSIKETGIIFIAMVLGSTIQSMSALISNDLVPIVRDFLTSLAGDVRVFVISVAIQNLIIGFLPQVIVVSILTQDLDLIAYASLAYLAVYSIAVFISTIVKTPTSAQTLGLLLYLLFLMTAPIYLTTTIWVWRAIPLSILNPKFRDFPQILYTMLLSLVLLYYSLSRRM